MQTPQSDSPTATSPAPPQEQPRDPSDSPPGFATADDTNAPQKAHDEALPPYQSQQISEALTPEALGLSSSDQNNRDEGELIVLAPAAAAAAAAGALGDIDNTTEIFSPAAAPGDYEFDLVEAPEAAAPQTETDREDALEVQARYDNGSRSNRKGHIVVITVAAVAGALVVAMIGVFLFHQRALKRWQGGAVDTDRTACAACSHACAEGACVVCGTLCCFCCAAY